MTHRAVQDKRPLGAYAGAETAPAPAASGAPGVPPAGAPPFTGAPAAAPVGAAPMAPPQVPPTAPAPQAPAPVPTLGKAPADPRDLAASRGMGEVDAKYSATVSDDASAAMRDVGRGYQSGDVGAAAQGVLGLGKMAGAIVTGPLESIAGHGMAAGLHGVGKVIGAVTGKDVTAEDTPEKLYGMGREAVDTATSAMGPMGPNKTSFLGSALGHVPAVPPPVPPTSGPLGVTLSEGQKAASPELLKTEEAAARGQLGPAAQRRAQQFDAQQSGQVAAAKENVTKSLSPTGEVEAETPRAAAEIAQQKFQAAEQASKADVDARFEAARGQGGAIHGGSMAQSGDVVRSKITAPGPNKVTINEKLIPQTANMIEHLDQRIAGLNGNPMSLEEVDELRKELGRFRTAAWSSNAEDGRAASAAVKAFNEHINESVNSGDFIGSPGVRQAWNDAVAASAKYHRTFGANDKVGSVVQKVLGDYKNPAAIPNDVADHLYSASGTNPGSLNVGVANRFKQVLGETSKEWGAVKQGLFQRLTDRGPGQTEYGPKQIADRLNKFLNGDGKEMAEATYSPAERDMLQKFADLHRCTSRSLNRSAATFYLDTQ
jgi:hypothetical protein